MPKTTQLQIRVSRSEKDLIRAAAGHAGQDMSSWILALVLSEPEKRFRRSVNSLSAGVSPAGYAELIDLLEGFSEPELCAVKNPLAEVSELSLYDQNYVCALVEQRANAIQCAAPEWTRSVPVLSRPFFGTQLQSLRAHLLVHSLVAFRRRNIFVDSALGARV